ncbi:MAG: CmpA/NrtA family ABC transporter substrate-binding protein [Serratia proteamaculans]|jgi:nitrate/nitrite transport system substrate-binding protein|uniref:ABC transporter substrate-binding protein n=1 Tax=Serratia proteamaculans TaxID=28151 RepID=A0ABS0TMI7_SERPR|nr:CmpA/NrtA family ABC transporter substrate-binding protein [Serratia proteamaculans]SPZ55921.1 Nitrate transport protein NrtA precursor [Serratia quinivorans]KAB1498990.1 ABC transporter substrate-binding protein [Serratia proteamaculans]MBI6179566.1 ABC transporter substrate-binding protein [Serratia proteamaculans]NWA71702.1 ABC transporter substrate-binding protein [Serratia proteamaculans]RYM53077.1 nitrate/bicarbonate ABC transporter substrate-binding protein [Serratia proteamaculans]
MTHTKLPGLSLTRRRFLAGSAALGGSMMLPGLMNAAWAAGSDAPEKKEIRVGFIPLTDCASVVMAAVKQFDRKYGIKIIPSKEASWAAVRDKLLSGELDAAHVLYGMVYGLQLGVAGPQQDMAVLMTLNNNGQAITLSNQLKQAGVTDAASLKKTVDASAKGTYTFAQTFPTGTHAMWLYYWLANAGIHPFDDVRNVVVPPPQMVMNMKIGNMSGFCVGEPWNQRAIAEDIGFTAVTSQEIWPDHPEKVLGTTGNWVAANPNSARALTAAVLDAARWIDSSDANRQETAQVVAGRAYINTKPEIITGRMLGQYQNGLGKSWQDAHAMRFFHDGEVSYPYLSDGMWFLTQHRRWGLLSAEPDYLAVAKKINRTEIYKQAASAVGGVNLPTDDMRTSTLLDGKRWDGSNPAEYANSFSLKR